MTRFHLIALLAAVGALAVGGSAGADPDDGFDAAAHVESIVASSPPSPRARSRNVEVLAHVYPGPGTNADVFGYRQHAYLASWVGRGCLSKGVRVYDLADPSAPEHVSTFADAASDPSLQRTWTEKVIVTHVSTPAFNGDLAVVSFQTCSGTADRLNPAIFRGFGLYDVTDPAEPKKLALYATEPGVNRGSHEIWIEAVGPKAYVYTAVIDSELRTNKEKADFRIIDVTDPRAPVQVGQWGAWEKLGIHPRPPGQQNFVHSVIVNEQATRAYLSYWDLGTVILDISNPADPRYLGRTTFTADETGNAHSAAIARGDKLLIETREVSAGLPTFFDISNPATPIRLSQFVVDGYQNDTVHDPKTRGSLAYFSWYSLGVVVADMSRPENPRFVAQFVPEHDVVNPDFFCTEPCTEIWGVFVDRSYVLASDMNSGLWVFRVH
jgi:hypothetical protein